MKKTPKKYECIECGFVSNRHKSINFPSVSFACCFKCRGRVKEREEWLDWLYGERNKYYGNRNVANGPKAIDANEQPSETAAV